MKIKGRRIQGPLGARFPGTELLRDAEFGVP